MYVCVHTAVWRAGGMRMHALARAHAIRVYLYVARRLTRVRLSVVRLFSFFWGSSRSQRVIWEGNNVMLHSRLLAFSQLTGSTKKCADRLRLPLRAQNPHRPPRTRHRRQAMNLNPGLRMILGCSSPYCTRQSNLCGATWSSRCVGFAQDGAA